jgi:hypothetical protein
MLEVMNRNYSRLRMRFAFSEPFWPIARS